MATIAFKNNEIILLLGAGASVEANMPDSNAMVQEIEAAVSQENTDWTCYRDLYRFLRSSIFFADGLTGSFGDDVPYNIERLVNVLDELHQKERHTLYPFVGAWNPMLLDLAGSDFKYVREFQDAIITQLRNHWVALPEREKASYYAGLLRFQGEYGYPLRVFSLNYDLCVEETCGHDKVQRGFSNRIWDWRLFDETSDDQLQLLLYKLHGSMDWYFTKDGRVTYSDSPSSIQNEEIALIFGTSYKLQYVDPFLFLAYELRRWTLDVARIIICIGYGFNDNHINGILQQSLRLQRDRKLLAVIGECDEITECKRKQRIIGLLSADEDQVETKACGVCNMFCVTGNSLYLAHKEEVLWPEKENPQVRSTVFWMSSWKTGWTPRTSSAKTACSSA